MRQTIRIAALLSILASMFVGGDALAQEGSIQNPGFEHPYHQVAMSRLDPGGWIVRQLPGQHGMETRPAMSIYDNRIRSGETALQLFNVHAPLNAVVYQPLTVSGGLSKKVTFSIHFHGWWWGGGDPEWSGGYPISEDEVSRGKVLILDREPSPAVDCPQGSGVPQQDTWRKIESTRTFPPGTRIWVGVCLNSPMGQTNDFYVDDAAINIVADFSPTPIPEVTVPYDLVPTATLTPTPTPETPTPTTTPSPTEAYPIGDVPTTPTPSSTTLPPGTPTIDDLSDNYQEDDNEDTTPQPLPTHIGNSPSSTTATSSSIVGPYNPNVSVPGGRVCGESFSCNGAPYNDLEQQREMGRLFVYEQAETHRRGVAKVVLPILLTLLLVGFVYIQQRKY
jgi:hypothetical protein